MRAKAPITVHKEQTLSGGSSWTGRLVTHIPVANRRPDQIELGLGSFALTCEIDWRLLAAAATVANRSNARIAS